MNIVIIGAGALGKLYGGLLTLSNHTVHFLVRSEFNVLSDQKYFNIEFKEQNQNVQIHDFSIHQKPSELPRADLIIISVKTTENHNLKQLIAQSIQKNTTLLVIQNGIGNEEYIHSLFPDQNLISAISTAAVTRSDNAKIDVYFLGELRISPFSPSEGLPMALDSLFTADIDPKIVKYDNFKLMRWQKLIWNVPFCALSIIYNQSSQQLAMQKPYVDIVYGLMKEVQKIAQSEGAIISDEYIEKTLSVTKGVNNYYPSMYWDYQNQKPIEQEYIIENVVKCADQNQIPAPLLHLAYSHLNQLYQQKQPKN